MSETGSSSTSHYSVQIHRTIPLYQRRMFVAVKSFIEKEGVRALADKTSFLQYAECRLDKIAILYIKIAYDENAIEKMIGEANTFERSQQIKVGILSREISKTYGLDEEFMQLILSAFMEAICRAGLSERGKNTCAQLKELRRLFALTNGIDYEEEDCTYEGPCEGTCPYCDAKTKELLQKAEELKIVEYPQVDIDEIEPEEMDDRDELVEGLMEIREFDEMGDDDYCTEDSSDSKSYMCGGL